MAAKVANKLAKEVLDSASEKAKAELFDMSNQQATDDHINIVLPELVPQSISESIEVSITTTKQMDQPTTQVEAISEDADQDKINEFFSSLNIETEVETEEMAPMTKKDATLAKVFDLRAPELRRAKNQTDKIKQDVSQVDILGYFLLSKRETCLAPLYVGCVFKNIENGKFYVKVRKMMYEIPFLLRFIGGSPQSGNQISLLDGTQGLQTPLSVEKIEQILKHQETLIDYYPVFMRNQVYKKQHPKWESNFSALKEIDETEIELEGVTNVVDFTRTIFSVDDQSYIHLVCENESGQAEIRQVYIE